MAFSSVPCRLGPYLVRSVLCTTSAGAMLRVEGEEGGRRGTVMLLDPDLPRWPARLRERMALPQHPRLCSLDAGPARVRQGSSTYYYLATESLSGWTALDEIARDGMIAPLERALRFCAEAAEALACAHAAGLPHGHLEPGCLFIQTLAPDDPGHIKLLGAGLDVIAGAASRAGRYRTPEDTLALGRRARPGHTSSASAQSLRDAPRGPSTARMAADVYALGGILYHMLTGHPPEPSVPIAVEAGILRISSMAPQVAAVLRKALSSSPATRFTSALELREALLQARSTLPAPRNWTAPPAPLWETGHEPGPRSDQTPPPVLFLHRLARA